MYYNCKNMTDQPLKCLRLNHTIVYYSTRKYTIVYYSVL